MSDEPLLDHFEKLHADGADPWDLTTRWYEQRKQVLTMAALPQQHYRAVFEPGCSVGALTELLAPRADHVLAADASPSAVETCRQRTSTFGHVDVVQMELPGGWPDARFDLVVLSEMGYYLQAAALEEVLDRTVGSLTADGAMIAVHWRRVADDFVLAGGDEVHARIDAHPGLRRLGRWREDEFLIDVLGPAQ